MSRFACLIVAFALGAVVIAQEAVTAAELIKKLGHDDYEVREQATKELVAMGPKAVPELEKALEADDLEVRLRAGRALRSIRAKHAPAVSPVAPQERRTPAGSPGREGRVVATEMSIANGKVKLKVTRLVGGKRVQKSYEATSIEELKKRHPELRSVLGNFRVRTRNLQGRDRDFRFDMEKFWKDFGKKFDDDFWRTWQMDIEKEAERLRKLTEQWRKQWGKDLGGRNSPGGADPLRVAMPGAETRSKLGATAGRPSRVLDAQLGLRGRGLVIDRILSRSVANQLGLQRYDILVELNGVAIRRYSDIMAAMKNHTTGDVVSAKVIRRAKETALSTKR